MSTRGWHRRILHAEGPNGTAAERTIEQCAMSAAGVGLYGLAIVRRGLGAERYVAQLGAGGRGIGPWTTDCLDLVTGEEFTVSSTDPDVEARRIAVTELPPALLAGLATRRRGPPDPSRLQRQPARTHRRARAAATPRAHRRQCPRPSEPVRMTAAHHGGHQVDVDERNARWDRDLKLQLAGIRADEILRDLRRLQRDWRAYQRRHVLPIAGQLDLFTNT